MISLVREERDLIVLLLITCYLAHQTGKSDVLPWVRNSFMLSHPGSCLIT